MIPKIIHQIWIGPRPAPEKLMATWKEKNPSFEYIRWPLKHTQCVKKPYKSSIILISS